jgi:dUTP pyrophosphatase
MIPKLKFKKIYQDVVVPFKATDGSAGMDVRFYSENGEKTILAKNKPVALSTGLCVEIPSGYEIQVRSRSGLSLNGVIVLNAPGTIDSDYRQELKIILCSTVHDAFEISHGDRIAQLVFAKLQDFEIEQVSEIKESTTRVGGFGSTGVA